MSNDLAFRPKTSDIPTQPGVYRFFDENHRVLYVGKAKNLRARLQSYFAPIASIQERTKRMLLTANRLDWTIVGSELEALQLEFTWIKEFEPPFNVRFRDDKSYPYLAVSIREEVPRVFITRNREIKGVKYFGPYTQAWSIKQTLDALLKVYPIRSCSGGVYKTARSSGRPCLLADIGKCSAPCVGRIDKPSHQQLVGNFLSFMGGMNAEMISGLRTRMLGASTSENFELAAKLRDEIEALESVLQKSSVVMDDQVDADFIAVADDELIAAVCLFSVRAGRIRGVRSWVVDKELEQKPEELARQAIAVAYDAPAGVEPAPLPPEIYVQQLPSDSSEIEDFLFQRNGRKTRIQSAKRGQKFALLENCLKNAEHSLETYKLKRSADFTARSNALNSLARSLELEAAPFRIECYDISHLSGKDAVGSMVVFEDALAKKNLYRQFNIDNFLDDAQAIYQVLTRRLRYLRDDSDLDTGRFSQKPSLIVVDGGLPQVKAAEKALTDSLQSEIPVIGLAKRLEEVWRPNQDYPLILTRSSEELFLLQRIRDESHRFALTASKKKRSRAITSRLLEIPGLGERRVGELLKRFGSVKRLSLASESEIAETAGIGPVLATEIKKHLR